jgi:hypothetical protein
MKTLIIVCKKNRDYNGIIITTLGLSHIIWPWILSGRRYMYIVIYQLFVK